MSVSIFFSSLLGHQYERITSKGHNYRWEMEMTAGALLNYVCACGGVSAGEEGARRGLGPPLSGASSARLRVHGWYVRTVWTTEIGRRRSKKLGFGPTD